MAKAKIDDKMPQPDMTPMIDCIFQLLIFFMCSIKFKVIEGKLLSWLPKDKGSQNIPPPKLTEEISVRVTFDEKEKKLHYYLISREFPNVDDLIKEVKGALELKKASGETDAAVKLGPARNVPMQPIIALLDACKLNNIDKVEFQLLDESGLKK